MKTVLTAGYTFAPAQRRLDFTGVPGFDARRLLAVIHVASGDLLYATGTPSIGGSFANSLLTLVSDTTALSPSDALTVLYEADLFSPASPAATTDAGLGTDGASAPAIAGTGVRGWLRAIYERLTSGVIVQGAVTVSDGSGPLTIDGSVGVTNFPATQAITAATLPLPANAATAPKQDTGNAYLASIDGKLPALVGGKIPVAIDGGSVTITGSVTIPGEIEIKNDVGNPALMAESQLRGVHDDGTSEGSLNARLVQGELVRVPFVRSMFNGNLIGTSAWSQVVASNGYNLDGSGQEVTLSVQPGPNQGAWIEGYFNGRAFGVSYLRYSGGAPFDVSVDGCSYPVNDAIWQVAGASKSLYENAIFWWPDELPDGQHRYKIMLASDPAGVSVYRARLLHLLCERRAGYRDPLPVGIPVRAAVPTIAAAITTALALGQIKAIRRIDYYNPTGAAITVTLNFGSVSNPIWSASVPAGGLISYDPGDWMLMDGGLGAYSHVASATGLIATAYGRTI